LAGWVTLDCCDFIAARGAVVVVISENVPGHRVGEVKDQVFGVENVAHGTAVVLESAG
jgi:hypothetical protein